MVGFELNIVTGSSSTPPSRSKIEAALDKKGNKRGWRAKRKAVLDQRRANDERRYFEEYGEEFARGDEEELEEKGGHNADAKLEQSGGGVSRKRQQGQRDRTVKKRPRITEQNDKVWDAKESGAEHSRKQNSTVVNSVNEETWAATMGVVGGTGAVDDDVIVGSNGTEEINGDKNVMRDSGFVGIGLDDVVAKHLAEKMSISEPTPVQKAVVESLVKHNGEDDLLIRSSTGSGKTLAYVLPILHFLLNRENRISREEGTYAMILAPTRELAEQVEDVATRVCRPWHWIVVGSVRGGENKHKEKSRLRKGISILVATPGRLLDHMRNTRSFNYSRCEFLVLDEADRLLDLGFETDIKEAIQSLDYGFDMSGIRRKRCNLLLSATVDRNVKRLAEFSLKAPEKIVCDDIKEDRKFAMPQKLNHFYSVVEQRHRLVTLAAFLRLRALKGANRRLPPDCKIMVFFSSCDSVEFHYRLFQVAKMPGHFNKDDNANKGFSNELLPLDIFMMHGNRDQKDRKSELHGFRRSSRAVLFCTDVAARGLDVKGVGLAIQYDPPTGGADEDLEYLHRAGRTARIGERGDTLVFLLPSEKQYTRTLEESGVKISEISGEAALAALQPNFEVTDIPYAARLSTSLLQEMFEHWIKTDDSLKELAVCGYQTYCRAYATHSRNSKHIFHVRNLHLGHVARAFGLVEKPKDFSLDRTTKRLSSSDQRGIRASTREATDKGKDPSAAESGEAQPYNDRQTTLSRRRREGGKNLLARQELASEFAA